MQFKISNPVTIMAIMTKVVRGLVPVSFESSVGQCLPSAHQQELPSETDAGLPVFMTCMA